MGTGDTWCVIIIKGYIFSTRTRGNARQFPSDSSFSDKDFGHVDPVENFIEILYLLEITDSTKQNEIRKVSFFRIDTNLE